jgi:hypothetical protein
MKEEISALGLPLVEILIKVVETGGLVEFLSKTFGGVPRRYRLQEYCLK